MTAFELIDVLGRAQGAHSDRPVLVATREDEFGNQTQFSVAEVLFDYSTNRIEIVIDPI